MFSKLTSEDKIFVREEIVAMLKDISLDEIGGLVVNEMLLERIRQRIILGVLKLRTVIPFEQIEDEQVRFLANGSHAYPNFYTEILLMKLKLAYPL